MFVSGASTVSPMFRIIDAFRGTLILDESDFRFSDEKAEIVKILNNGNAVGFPVLGVPADVRARRTEAIRSFSRSAYATPREEVEAILKAANEQAASASESPPEEKTVGRRSRPEAKTDTGAAKETVLPGRGGAQHKYLQSLVKKLAEDRRFQVSIEQVVLDGHGHVDVALEREGMRIACEISVSTRVSHELGNLTKGLAAGFHYAVLLSSDERALALAREQVLEADRHRVRLLTPEGFIEFLDDLSRVSPPIEERTKPKQPGVPPQPSLEGKRMLNTKDAAAYVGLAVQTLAEMRVSGESPPFYKLGRQVFYDRAELDEWIALRRRRSTSDPGPAGASKRKG
jgi:predicted DNA-binding transcriptional regulator AlpA